MEEHAVAHNHDTNDTKPRGVCPACDEYLNQAQVRRTPGGRAALASEWLMARKSGPYSRPEMADAGARFGSGRSSVSRMISIHGRSKDIFQKVKLGELSMAEASRQAGFIEYGLGERNLPDGGTFGKGDKFWEAVSPISKYINSWGKRNYQFPHLAPKEAARRLRKVEALISELEQMKDDLIVRSDDTRLTVNDH